MIAADSSTWIAFLHGEAAPDTEELRGALHARQVRMVPIVLAELLSSPTLAAEARTELNEVPALELTPGFWHRAGALRATVLGRGRKAMLPDVLIAQACIDHGLPLLTRDTDFRAIAAASELVLILLTATD